LFKGRKFLKCVGRRLIVLLFCRREPARKVFDNAAGTDEQLKSA
jgi:hypothetical protein